MQEGGEAGFPVVLEVTLVQINRCRDIPDRTHPMENLGAKNNEKWKEASVCPAHTDI